MSSVEILLVVATMLGGLALFLTGMDTMSESLTKLTGGALKKVIGAITNNRFFAFLFGTVLTAIAQSSSAITVLSVGLVNSGLIELAKAAGLIIGANLGTTATAWLLSLNTISGESFVMTLIKPSTFSPFLAIIAVAIKMICKSEKMKTIASALLGFAIMMIGMNLMSQAVSPLREVPFIKDTLVSFTNPLLGFLVACLFAMLIQSSDAVIGIVQAFAISVGITFGMAIPLICGAQVGTCITALLASLGTSNNGKRTALLNLYYNLLKTIPFMIIFYLLNSVFHFSFMNQNVGAVGIPLFHTLLNLLGCIVWLPLSNFIVSLANRTIPLSREEKLDLANTLTMLDTTLLGAPGIAIEQANKAVILLSETVGDAFKAVVGIRQDPDNPEEARILCDRSEKYQTQIDNYLLEISEHDIDLGDRAYLQLLSTSNTAFGRMGKVAERILNMIGGYTASADNITSEERIEVRVVGESIFEIMQLTFNGFIARNKSFSLLVPYYREEIMDLSAIAKRRYIRRVHEEGRVMNQNTFFADVYYAEEQLIDYCDMIADAVIRYNAAIGEVGPSDIGTDDRVRQQVHELFKDKFEKLEADYN